MIIGAIIMVLSDYKTPGFLIGLQTDSSII